MKYFFVDFFLIYKNLPNENAFFRAPYFKLNLCDTLYKLVTQENNYSQLLERYCVYYAGISPVAVLYIMIIVFYIFL